MSHSVPFRPAHTLAAPGLIGTALAAGAALGTAGFVVDQVTLPGGRILIVLLSTGLSWGAAAVAAGALARSGFTASIGGLVALLSAVVTYYGGIHVLGLRPTADSSALLAATAVWSTAAAAGGPLAGLAGWYARFGRRGQRSVAWGILSGLLLGQGLRWTWRYGLNPDPVFTSTLLVPLGMFAWGIRRGSLAYGLPALALTAAVSWAAWSVLAAAV